MRISRVIRVSAQTLHEHILAGTDSRMDKQKAITGLRKTIIHIKKNLASHERKLRRLENSILPTSLDVEPDLLSFDRIASKKEVEAIKIIASRMREARRLCEHTITQAAALLGVTQGDLKNVENAVDVDYVPLWLISRAAETYCVPTDYLFGLVEDWDASDGEAFLSRNHLAALQRRELENFTKTAAEQIKQDVRLKAINTAVVAFGLAVQHINDVFTQFRQLNYSVFDNLPGGARVLRQIQLAEELGQHATATLTKYKCLPESLAAHAEQMEELFPNNSGSFTD